jgi:hypothetical protein
MVCLADVRQRLPCVTSWPRDAPREFLEAVSDAYYAESAPVNRFRYSVLVHRADTAAEALRTLSDAGAFATQRGRGALLEVVNEARNTEWCKPELLDTLARYATYAFVLDGARVTCGAL